MLLSSDEVKVFFKLHGALMQFVIAQLDGAGVGDPATPYSSLPPAQQYKVVQAFLDRRDLINAFIAANPAKLSAGEMELVSSWRHLVAGRFIALRQLKKHMILLPCDQESTVYGVTGLFQPIERMIPAPLPAMIETVLLPFHDRIIYDGFISGFNVSFGPGSRRGFEDSFRQVKLAHGVVTSLPSVAPTSQPINEAPKFTRAKAPKAPGADVQQILTQVIALTDAFCQARLNEEYAELCRKLAKKLAAKRPSPLFRGQLQTWACGIVRTIGWMNFLDDPSQSPHMKLPEIDRAFGVAESTGQGKAKSIRQLLKIHQFDHHWILPSQWENHSPIWMLQDANGFIIDIRQQPVVVQRAAFQKGLIPYVPADRAGSVRQE